jgi:DNA-3-methyladenine glycosylase I
MTNKGHKAPWECTFAKEDKSRCKPGGKPKSDEEYFEILCLCILQAGLNWNMVRKNWPNIKQGFYGFDINKLSKLTTGELVNRPGVYNNKNKVEAIVANAKEFQKIKQDFGSFSNFLKSLKRLNNKEAIKELAKQFKHIGEYTAEYYLHCVGY